VQKELVTMIELSIEEIRHKAESWHADGQLWHFHMLVPGCAFNGRRDCHAFVLENTSSQEVFVFYSEEPQVEADHALLLLLHGDDILNETQASLDPGSIEIQPILARAKELSARGISWHHHMLCPGCIFSEQPEKWVITFEDPETEQVIGIPYDTEPEGDLRKLELLFFDQQALR
jgi:hypothetical protein